MDSNSPKRWHNLEEQFFKSLDNRLIEQLRQRTQIEQSAEAIAQLTGITDPALAQKIASLNITAETLAAFRLVPLVAVAWASDRIEANERMVIDEAVEKSGLDQSARELLGTWTKNRPGSELLDIWCQYAGVLIKSLDESQRKTLRDQILSQAQAVAEAAGGVLGFGSVSPSEKATIDKIKKALGG